MIRIAHFVIDEKFIDDSIAFFDSFIEYESNYYIVRSGDYKQNKFIKSSRIINLKHTDVKKNISDASFCDILIIHSLGSLPYYFIPTIHPDIKVVWLSWGLDIYSNKFPQFQLVPLRNRTSMKGWPVNMVLKTFAKSTLEYCRNQISFYIKKGKRNQAIFKDAIKRIDFFSGVFPMEYDLVKNNIQYFRAIPICFNYIPVEDIYNPTKIMDFSFQIGSNIQVGQYAIPLANHLDTFDKLRKIRFGEKKIICPLSYGRPYYANVVAKQGKKIFGDKFIALKDFVSLGEYKKYMNSIGYAIHNIKQQAAVGNILMNLWNGAKVFVPKNSINYLHFSNMGIKMFTIEDDLNEKEFSSSLSADDVIRNRTIISSYYGILSVKNRMEESFNKILQSDCN